VTRNIQSITVTSAYGSIDWLKMFVVHVPKFQKNSLKYEEYKTYLRVEITKPTSWHCRPDNKSKQEARFLEWFWFRIKCANKKNGR
jgi:hypothetical protein